MNYDRHAQEHHYKVSEVVARTQPIPGYGMGTVCFVSTFVQNAAATTGGWGYAPLEIFELPRLIVHLF